MELYLLRHGIAENIVPGQQADSERSLTEEGIKKMQKAARGMKSFVDVFDTIISSPYLRAEQTARIVAEEYNCVSKLEQSKYFVPDTSIKKMLDHLDEQSFNDRVLIVGHEPSISALASYLIGIDRSVIEFKKGTMCRIDADKVGFGKGFLVWHLQPKQIRSMSKKKDKGL